MGFLAEERLAAFDVDAFLAREPYPWANPQGWITDEGFAELVATLPPVERFEAVFDKKRKYGQKPHDRYTLEWEPGLDLPAPWQAFIDELHGPVYQGLLERAFGFRPRLRIHWHYTPRGCSVSPHCDSKRKLGSQIFYMNTEADWDPAWGGETLVLDDGGRFHSDSHPEFEEFDKIESAETLGNRSLLFVRRGDSWHGVREVTCPEGRLRKVFILVFEKPSLGARLGRLLRRAA